MPDDGNVLENAKWQDYNTTNLRLKNTLNKQRTYLNDYRDKLNRQNGDLEKEKIRLAGMHVFIKNTQVLQDKVQLHIKNIMQGSHMCLKVATEMDNSITGIMQCI